MNNRKRDIAHSFGRAVGSYDHNAPVQRESGRQLLQHIAEHHRIPLHNGLEIGCGTGLLTDHLLTRYSATNWLITDLSPQMVSHCRDQYAGRANFQVLDGESAALQSQYDLIISNLAFQWFEDLPASIERLYQHLSPGGSLAFTTLGQSSFREWQQAHTRIGLQAGTPPYPTLESLAARLPNDAIQHLDEKRITHTYLNGLDFLQRVRNIGAGTPSKTHQPLSAGQFRRVLRTFDDVTSGHVTYHLLFIQITRPL